MASSSVSRSAPSRVQELQGSDILAEALVRENVEVIFGYPGGASMEIHQALTRLGVQDKIRVILPRHEQGGIFMAEGYAKATGKVGSRPGDVRSGSDQPGDGNRRRQDGLGPHRGGHRAGAPDHDREGRLPGDGHRRDHPSHHQAQLPGAEGLGAAPHRQGGLLRGLQRAARSGSDRHPQGRPTVQRQAQVAVPRGPPELSSANHGQGPGAGSDRAGDSQVQAAHHLRRQRHHLLQRLRRVAALRREDGHSHGHDGPGPGQFPGRPSSLLRHAGHAWRLLRQLRGQQRRSAAGLRSSLR